MALNPKLDVMIPATSDPAPAPKPNLRPVYTPIIVAPCPSGASDLE
eukprot:CAMPEP_0179419862 /NCGR_PEP_ID=MMETSP0799-20121207/8842_1 /TAXON_ID=46947 /ORGANISM="Geminigera cryophila, Strain CCMP2564" /LENGTH=45 /DNA_ID= /DNA_START= /DNA_END= /DNA_ORIENTATION=